MINWSILRKINKRKGFLTRKKLKFNQKLKIKGRKEKCLMKKRMYWNHIDRNYRTNLKYGKRTKFKKNNCIKFTKIFRKILHKLILTFKISLKRQRKFFVQEKSSITCISNAMAFMCKTSNMDILFRLHIFMSF